MFGLHASSLYDYVFVTRTKNAYILWHHRLGHVGGKGLKTIIDKKLVDDISNYFVGKNDLCDHCVFVNKIGHNFLKDLIQLRDL